MLIQRGAQHPRANAFVERGGRSVRHELLDRTIIWKERQLRALLEEYVRHYHEHRPHRSLGQRAPACDDVAVIGSAEPVQRHSPPAADSSTSTAPQPEPRTKAKDVGICHLDAPELRAAPHQPMRTREAMPPRQVVGTYRAAISACWWPVCKTSPGHAR